MNKAILMGRLTRDPEVRYSQGGASEPLAICRYTIAVNRRFKRAGEADADFIPCVVFGKSAEFAEKYFKKGMLVLVSGRIQVSSWDDTQTGQKRWTTEVVVEDQEFAESKSSFENRSNSSNSFNNSYGSQDSFAPYEQQASSPQPSNAQPKQTNNNSDGFAAISESIDDDEDLPF